MALGLPLTTQGQLNRVLTQVTVTDFPVLQVGAQNMSKAQAVMTFEGSFNQQIGTATGVINSPEPFVMANLVVSLLRPQPLAAAWLAQAQNNVVLGTVNVYTDSPAFGPITLANCSIMDIDPGTFDGADPTVKVTIKGAYY